ncbi:MAG: hypothetical protein L0212_05170 [Acidobacteria bacterium]|nr:hypothetical protein [Acidobacteriota bacterium]
MATDVGAEPQRLKPPAGLSCPRDHLTAYSGSVIRYRRTAGRIVLRIRTDWDTTESATLKPPAKTRLEDYLLVSGKAFAESDWEKIEFRPRRLRPKTRATAWVCDDGRPPVIDWHPPEGADPAQKPR